MVLKVFSTPETLVALNRVSDAAKDIDGSTALLSSGRRVNRAADDAASFAIGSRLTFDVVSLGQATTNASQATSLLQLADGAQSEIVNLLTRAKVLATTAEAGNFSDAERALFDVDFQGILEEIDRIAKDTEFNGDRILSAENTIVSGPSGDFEEGQNGVINITVRNFNNLSRIDGGDGAFDFDISYSATGQTVSVSDNRTGPVFTTGTNVGTTGAGTATGATTSPNVVFISNSTNNLTTWTSQYLAPTEFFFTIGASQVDDTNNQLIFTRQFFLSEFQDATNAASLNQQPDDPLVLQFTNGQLVGGLTDFTVDNAEIFIILDNDFALNPTVPNTFTDVNTNSVPTANPAVTTSYNDQFSIGEDAVGPEFNLDYRVGGNVLPTEDEIGIELQGLTIENLVLSNLDIQTRDHARLSFTLVDRALEEVLTARTDVGAEISRFEFARRNLATVVENSEAARSRVLDLDVAEEITRNTANLIRLQTGISTVAQNNDFRERVFEQLIQRPQPVS